MKSTTSEIKLIIGKFLKNYRFLLFWLIWGAAAGLVFGFMLHDYQTYLIIFMGFGIYLGLTLQFLKSKWLKRGAFFLSILVALIIVSKPAISLVQRTLNMKINKSYLVEDVRELASILEETHPNPYYHGGGKIAFHRRMQEIIRTIPEEGLTKVQFYKHISPFLASVGDGHTSFWPPFNLDPQSPGGIGLKFHPVENYLYVAGVIDQDHQHLLGSKLVSVEKILFADLLKRQTSMKGYDNEFQLLRNLGYDGSLWYGNLLSHLVPEWNGGKIEVVLEKPDGSKVDLNLEPNKMGLDNLIFLPTKVDLPSIEKSNYVYRFMDEGKNTLLLLIENMYTYRESFEMEMKIQNSLREGLAEYLYSKYNSKPPPSDNSELIAGLPSATELFKELLMEMKENRSENLIIDLRRNQGGNAFLSTIFYYFLYGKEALISFSDRKSIFIKKYSPLFWRQYGNWNIDDINEYQPIELTESDYDFSNYPQEGSTLSRDESIRIIEDEASTTATFWEEYRSEKYSGYYCPKNIFILCSPLTNSSGYAFMYDHWSGGGKVVGIPSSQAGNTCGAWVGFKLTHSQLSGGISHLYITHFRDDPEMGRTFRPDHEMTYKDLKSFDFDPNAEILFTLQLIDSMKTKIE